MADIVHFAEAKADRSGDSRDWTAIDMLKSIVRDIEKGRVSTDQICVHYWETNEDGGRIHHNSVAGMTFPDHVALLTVALHECVEGWKR